MVCIVSAEFFYLRLLNIVIPGWIGKKSFILILLIAQVLLFEWDDVTFDLRVYL